MIKELFPIKYCLKDLELITLRVSRITIVASSNRYHFFRNQLIKASQPCKYQRMLLY